VAGVATFGGRVKTLLRPEAGVVRRPKDLVRAGCPAHGPLREHANGLKTRRAVRMPPRRKATKATELPREQQELSGRLIQPLAASQPGQQGVAATRRCTNAQFLQFMATESREAPEPHTQSTQTGRSR
jgi:hypothetical protein